MRFLCVNGFSTCSCTRSLVIVVLVIEGRSELILKVIGQICKNYFSCRVEKKPRHPIPRFTNWQTFYCRN